MVINVVRRGAGGEVWNAVIVRPSRPFVFSFEAFESCIPVGRMSIIRLVCLSVKFRVPEVCHLTTLLKDFRKLNFRFRK